ncbi:hypothetical protein N7470_000441 [Penicillium chermesinum]|nr:hypothetical protein N7470_000441 [Penicillium chermesinum]
MPAAEDNIRTVSALATQLGNQISVQMLNYLSTTHDLPEGFRDLSHTFLDTCRTLWAIETGVTELAGANRSLPEVIIEEVGKKFDAAYREFERLEKVMLKLVQYEHRGTLGKLQRGFNRPGHELRRIHDSLKRINETLQISGMAFHWSLGEARPEDSVGIGYSNRISQGRSVTSINKASSIGPTRSLSSLHQHSSEPPRSPPSVPPKGSMDQYSQRYTPSNRGENSQVISHTDGDSIADDMSSILSLNTFLKPAGRIGEASSLDNRLMHYGPNKTHAVIPVDEVSSVSDRGSESHSAYHGKQAATPLTDTASSHRRPSPSLSRGDGNSQSMLSAAVRGRNYPLIEQLLTIGVSPDKSEHFHPLSEAVQQRDIEAVRLLLLHKADPNIPDSQSRVPLYLAVDQSFADGVTLLLKHGADANYRANAEIESPLSHAITSGNVEITRTLLTHAGNLAENARHDATFLIDAIHAGCDPDLKDRHGKTALCEAVQTDQPSVVTTLLDHHANPNLPGPEHVLWSAVHRPGCLRILLARGADIRKAPGIMEQATSVNNIDGVRVLLQAGIDPNLKKDGIYTPLCSAIRDDRPDIVSLLLSHSADPNAMASEYPAWKCITHNRLQYLPELLVAGANLRDPPGIAECAVANNNAKALRWVIEQGGANPNDRNSLGHTALTTALREDRPEMVKWLLEHGADPNLRGEDWPIYMAIRSSALLQLLLPYISDLSIHKGVMEKAVQADQLDSVKQLIAAGVNVEWKSGGVFSPLTTALRERHKPIVRYLLNEAGADPNAPGEHLPLVKAIRRCEPDDYTMIELLLEKGADPNKSYREWNAIMEAIENRDLYLLKLLIEKSGGYVDFTQKDETGKTILDLASASGWPEGLEVLQQSSN